MSPAAPRQGNLIQTNSSSHNHIHGYKSAFLLFSVLPFFFLSYLFLLSSVGFHGTKAGRQGGLVGGGDTTKKQRNSRLRGAEAPGFALSLLLYFPCCHSFFSC